MEEVSIRGKTFTRDEVCDYGKKSIARTKKILLIIGLALIGLAIVSFAFYLFSALSGNMVDRETGEKVNVTVAQAIVTSSVFLAMIGIPGVVLIIVSAVKEKKNPYDEGVKYLEKHFTAPVGFDGKVIALLVGDKEIVLNKRPPAKLIVSTAELQFQIMQNNMFSKIFSGKDVIDYEIKVDNEVVITSKTKTKKGAGKAIAGGLLFGEAGAIAGAVAGNSKSTTTSSQREIHHYTLAIKVNDLMKPSFVIELSDISVAEEVVATFMLLCNQKEDELEELTREVTREEKKSASTDKYDELKKLKELLDAGIITQEEFDTKKREILG